MASYIREELNSPLTNRYLLVYKFAKFGKCEALVFVRLALEKDIFQF